MNFHPCKHFHTFTDPRVEDWLLMKTPLTTAVFFFLYLFVVWAGPAFMRNRKPLQLKQLLILYNLGLVVLSVYMFYEVSILNKSENATPELFAICIQNYANQESE